MKWVNYLGLVVTFFMLWSAPPQCSPLAETCVLYQQVFFIIIYLFYKSDFMDLTQNGIPTETSEEMDFKLSLERTNAGICNHVRLISSETASRWKENESIRISNTISDDKSIPSSEVVWSEEKPSWMQECGKWSKSSIKPSQKITIQSGQKVDASCDEIVITSTQGSTIKSNRVIDLMHLRNYFELREPLELKSTSRFRSHFYLSLMDPSMPRLTSCGQYYRMRFAVYARARQPEKKSSCNNWREPSLTLKTLNSSQVVQFGEMHLYTLFPKMPSSDTINQHDTDSDFLHYENISFFANQSPSQVKGLSITCVELNQLSNEFRYYLKWLNSIVITQVSGSKDKSCDSTYLLEQLKYPKSRKQFNSVDRFCHQFLRNQTEMFTRYRDLLSHRKKEPTSSVEVNVSKSSGDLKTDQSDKQELARNTFVIKLFHLREQSMIKND